MKRIFKIYNILNIIIYGAQSVLPHDLAMGSFAFTTSVWWCTFLFMITIVPTPILLGYYSYKLIQSIEFLNETFAGSEQQKINFGKFNSTDTRDI